jgi:AGZA family xanthine/uracil permease-like MFS transporter
MSKFKSALDRYFGITEKGSKISTEVIAGITTFLTMAYILVVNPSILAGKADNGFSNEAMWESIYVATIIGAVVGTLLMALYAKIPFAQAPGMGLNAFTFFLISIVGLSYGVTMKMIFISGIIFLILSIAGIREKILNAVPEVIRKAIPVGIGLFIAYVGLQSAGIIVAGPTITSLATLSAWESAKAPLVCFVGVLAIAILSKLNIKGAILIGIIFSTLIGYFVGITDVTGLANAQWLPHFDKLFSSDPNVSSLIATWTGWSDFGALFTTFSGVLAVILTILSFTMIDMFDTFGTLYGTCRRANMLDENGNVPRFKQACLSDAIATVVGASVGTSTVTTYVESAAGVSVGGRTGLTALVVALFFLLALFLTPIFMIIPGAASASALIYVGVLMISTVKDINFEDPSLAVPAFVTLFGMPLAYSITDGIGLGIISYVLIKVILYVVNIVKYSINKEKYEKPAWEVHPITLVIFVLFVLKFVVPTNF